jgi:hypothetical protein
MTSVTRLFGTGEGIMARPRKYTDEAMIAALQETHGMVYHAAQIVGCDPDSIYNRAKTSEAVREAMEFERGLFVDMTVQKLFEAVNKGQPWAIRFALNALGRDRGFGKKRDTPGHGSGALKDGEPGTIGG